VVVVVVVVVVGEHEWIMAVEVVVGEHGWIMVVEVVVGEHGWRILILFLHSFIHSSYIVPDSQTRVPTQPKRGRQQGQGWSAW
jgi:hypothetical protein